MFALKKVIEKKLKMTFTQHILANIGFTGKKLSTYLQIKDQPKFEDKHDIVYLDSLLRIIDHNGRDWESYIFNHSCEKRCQHFRTNNFKIIGNGFKNNFFKRKVSEALPIKRY